MNPRNPLSVWQKFAQGPALREFGFATMTGLRDDQNAPFTKEFSTVSGHDCFPFPSPWSGPARVGPIFSARAFRRRIATCVKTAVLGFDFAMIPVESPAITTNQRGSYQCVNPLSFLPCLPFRLPVAWTIRPRAALAARPQAQFWPVQPTTTHLPAPLSAALAVWLRARYLRRSAHPATDLTAAFAAPSITTASRGTSPAGRFHFAAKVFSADGRRATLRRA